MDHGDGIDGVSRPVFPYIYKETQECMFFDLSVL